MRVLSLRLALQIFCCLTCLAGDTVMLHSDDYGVKADGCSDDGAAVEHMIGATSKSSATRYLLFPENAALYAHSVSNRYLFDLSGISNLTIDGCGTTFLLHPDIRFMRLSGCTNLVVKNLNVDFTPLPCAEALVTDLSESEGWIDVRVFNDIPQRLCGQPTGKDGEQAFFAMLWNAGHYADESCHYWIRLIESLPDYDSLRLHCETKFRRFNFIRPNETRISIPVPGIAHRYGPGGCIDIFDNHNLDFKNIELWSAPWFGFRVFRNSGELSFNRVHIRPRPGTARVTSTWRDGFHVKGNRAGLIWDNCILEGMNDDAFNISTHCRSVVAVLSPQRFTARQLYPLNPIPWVIGEQVVGLDPSTGRVKGSAVVTALETQPRQHGGQPAAPLLTVTTDQAIPDLAVQDKLWQPASTNPDTLIRNCTIRQSCRMQSSLTMESCSVTALLWFYGESIEGPGPQRVTLRNCVLRRGRGNRTNALIVSGTGRNRGHLLRPPRLIEEVELSNCRIYGGVTIRGAGKVVLKNNRLLEDSALFEVENNLVLEHIHQTLPSN
jgi:hypothetical protein